MAWTYSDWITYSEDNASRLSQLRLHIQEVSDILHEKGDSYTVEGLSRSQGGLHGYLQFLVGQEADLAAAVNDTRLYEVHSRLVT